jgi:hypothetical protein
MSSRSRLRGWWLLGIAFSLWVCGGCGGDDSGSGATAAAAPSAPTTAPLGNLDLSCSGGWGDSAGQSSAPLAYQQQSAPSCLPQFAFPQSRFPDFKTQVDFNKGQIQIQNQGYDAQTANFPLKSDGTFEGQLKFQQPVLNDFHGNLSCAVVFVVTFNGTAHCDSDDSRDCRTNMTTHVGFERAPTVSPRPTETSAPPEASPEPSLGPEPSSGPEPRSGPEPSAGPEPSSSPAPTLNPRPSVTSELSATVDASATPLPSAPPEPSAGPQPSANPGPSAGPRPSANPEPSATVAPLPTSPIPLPTGAPESPLTIHIPMGAASGQASAFGSSPLQISVGDTVTWVNGDNVEHSVAADDDSFSSGAIQPGASYSHSFNVSGTVTYRDSLHPDERGTVVVGDESSSPSSPIDPTAQPIPDPTQPNPDPTQPNPGPTQPFPGPSQSIPGPSPQPSPSGSPTPSPHPSGWDPSPNHPHPNPGPPVTIIPTTICVVTNPCPFVATTSIACPN